MNRRIHLQLFHFLLTSPPADGVTTSHIPVAMIPIARHSVLRAARPQLYPIRALRAPASSALARLLSTLAVLEQRDGQLQNSSLSAIAAAQKLGGSVTAFLAGSGVKGTSAAEAAKIKGLEKVVAVENDAYEKVWFFFPSSGFDWYTCC